MWINARVITGAAVIIFLQLPIACAQELPQANKQNPNEKDQEIVLVEPARTVEEALERQKQAVLEAYEELKHAKGNYDSQVRGATSRAIADISVLARRAVADGKLPVASNAWKAVLRLDPEKKSALEFFRTLGTLDEVMTEVAGVTSLLGNWKWMSGTEMEFRAGGIMILKSKGKIRRGKWKYDSKSELIQFFDEKGNLTDQVKLTRNDRMLEGVNRVMGPVWGVRID